MVPDPSLSIRERAIAAWPGAWQGKNLRDILATLGTTSTGPWRELPQADRDWILFTDEQPVSPSTRSARPARIQRPLPGQVHRAPGGTCCTPSPTPQTRPCGSGCCSSSQTRAVPGLRRARGCGPRRWPSPSPAGRIAELAALPLTELAEAAARRRRGGRADGGTGRAPWPRPSPPTWSRGSRCSLEPRPGLPRLEPLDADAVRRRAAAAAAGDRSCAPGLFGVVYVLDEPSAGLHPADAEPLLAVLDRLKAAGNSLFVVEHDMDVVRRADWVVDVGPGRRRAPAAGSCYSGPVAGLRRSQESATRRFLFPRRAAAGSAREPRGSPTGWLAAARRRPGTTCAASTSTSRSASSPRSPASPARASRRWSARCWPTSSRGTSGTHRPLDAADEEDGTGDEASGRRPRRGRRGDRAGGGRPARPGRPEADRPHPAVQPGDLHRPVRRACASCSPAPTRRGRAATAPAGSPSTSPAAGARPARARGSWRWSCCSCPAPTRPARPATGARYDPADPRGHLPRPHHRRRART